MIEFVIINYNTPELSCNCIDTILNTYNVNAKIVVVDNNSKDNSIEYIQQHYPQVQIIANKENLGYAKAVNLGVSACNSEFVLVSNSDVEFHKNSISMLENMMKKDGNIGVGGFLQVFPNGNPQRSYGYVPSLFSALLELTLLMTFLEKYQIFRRKYTFLIPKNIEVSYIDGAALLIRRELFVKLNGFDEDYFFYSEESDYCHRVKKNNYKNIINSEAIITHIRGASSGENKNFNLKSIIMNEQSQRLFLIKNCSKFTRYLYKIAKSFRYFILSILSSIISSIKSNESKENFNNKKIIFSEISKYWGSVGFD